MSGFQIYAFYVSPLLVLGVGLIAYWIAARKADREQRDKAIPGE